MKTIDIIRAWKDEDYRNSLSAAQRAALPKNPAGMVELSDSDMGKVAGGLATFTQACTMTTAKCDTPCQANSSC